MAGDGRIGVGEEERRVAGGVEEEDVVGVEEADPGVLDLLRLLLVT